ncbi:hypothetical protein [Pseudorhodoplanes sp.]|uniref:hypothetical protein n=1 Tax=Pseudorhodoplanes sp. TaxID=1934341 RepID=UPI002D80BF21|nr:hypothetical protein [Pseudorhodoplanes sp.]
MIVLLVAAVLWWYRRKMIKEAANDVADVLGRVRGSVRRERLEGKDEVSALTAIDDPVVAAATLILAVATDGPRMTREREQALRKVIVGVAAQGKAHDAIDYAKWATGRVGDAGVVIDTLAPLLRERLNEAEKGDLITMTRRVATAGGPPLPMLEMRMHKLRQKLGVVVH